MNRRVYYIDNLRWITVSLLIVYHAGIAYNTWGEANYIFFEPVRPIAGIVSWISPWFMPLMFLLAGVSARFSLQKRSMGEFLRERFLRLGIPLLLGMLLINPILSYVADVTHNGYEGNFFTHYGVFFSNFTDLTGYDGGFTLGHLWFIAVLILISLLACPVIRGLEALRESSGENAIRIVGILLAVLAVATFDIRFFGKQVILYFCVYLLGYFFFSDRNYTAKLSKGKWIFVILFLITATLNVILFIYAGDYETLNTICNYAAFGFGIPALVCLGHDHLDRADAFTKLNSKISYMFYILHFPVVVLCQYFLSLTGMSSILNYLMTLVITYPLIYGLCYLIGRMKPVRK